jgi:hypothetical protein
MRSDELHDFHDRADLVGERARERRAGLASTPEETRRAGSYSV